MIYKVIKTGLTVCNHVFVEGETFTEDEAKAMALDIWFKETNGETWAGKFIVTEDEKVTGKQGKKSKDNSPKDALTILKELNIDIEKAHELSKNWQALCKAVGGPKIAKVIRDYVKSNPA